MHQFRSALIAGLLLAICGAAQAQQEDQPPQWIERPTGESLFLFYPDPARHQGVVGRVILDCAISASGDPACTATSEEPRGWGFAEAGLGLSRTFSIRPATRNGQPSEGRLRVPLTFLLPESDDPEMAELIARQSGVFVELPDWDDAPNMREILAAYPLEAIRDGRRGRGLLSCLVRADRRLDCRVELETPSGHEFGAAAMSLAGRFRVAEHEGEYIARHRITRLLLPINFGARSFETPATEFTGAGPMTMPAPPDVVDFAYPPAARAAGVAGAATILCTLTDAMPDCVVESEQPAEWGFGAAALSSVGNALNHFDTWEQSMLPGDQLRFPFEFRR